MTGRESGSEVVTGTTDLEANTAAAFSTLGNETRLSILLALWDAYDPHGTENAISFTELRNRVGIRQGAQFNYHLTKLVGPFVKKTDAGYELERTGRLLVQSIIARTGVDAPTLESTVVDADCPLCGAPTAITYRDVRVYQVCTECDAGDPGDDHLEGALVGWTFEPTGLVGRTPEEVFTASTVKNFARIALRFEGICPQCSGPVSWSFDVCEDHESDADGLCPACGRTSPVFAREHCTVCKSAGAGSPGIKVLFHPAVVAFLYEHGIASGFTGQTDFEDVIQLLALVGTFEERVLSTEPLRVEVTIPLDGDELSLVLDESMRVVEVDERATDHSN